MNIYTHILNTDAKSCKGDLYGKKGEKVMIIKVISLNGNQATFSQYLIRWMFRIVDIWIIGGIVALIVAATTEKHQRIGIPKHQVSCVNSFRI